MADIKQNATFKAKANVNFSLVLTKYQQMKEYNKVVLERLRDYFPNANLPDTANLRYISRGDEIVFGDNLIIDTDSGVVTQYPKELFEQYAKCMVELPCKMRGNVEKEYQKMLDSAPLEEREALEAKKHKYVERFDVKPMLELVK